MNIEFGKSRYILIPMRNSLHHLTNASHYLGTVFVRILGSRQAVHSVRCKSVVNQLQARLEYLLLWIALLRMLNINSCFFRTAPLRARGIQISTRVALEDQMRLQLFMQRPKHMGLLDCNISVHEVSGE